MADLFPNARVVAVEANPPAIDLCHQTVRQRGKTGRVEIVGAAINSYDGRCTFHAIDAARTITPWSDGNIGASSLFKANGQYPHETYFQSPVEVPCVRLDSLLRTLNAETPQVIWLDLQGGEMLALQSLGERLCDVRLVHTEVSMKPAYDGQVLWPELRNFLVSGGFQIAPGGGPNLGEWQSDAIFYRPGKLR